MTVTGQQAISTEDRQNAIDGYIKSAKRWKDELARYQRPLAEDYSSGKIAIFYHLQPLASGVSDHQRDAVKDDSFLNNEPFPVLVFNQETAKFPNLSLLNQEPVFVLNVETVKTPEVVSIPSFVRLYYVQENVCETDKGLMLRSTFDERYKEFIGAHYGEVFLIRAGTVSTSNLEPSNVKGASQVMNGVSNDKSEVVGDCLSSGDLHEIAVRLRITLSGNLISSAVEEGRGPRFKIADVLVGPLDL